MIVPEAEYVTPVKVPVEVRIVIAVLALQRMFIVGVSQIEAPAPVMAPAAMKEPERACTGKIIVRATFDSSV